MKRKIKDSCFTWPITLHRYIAPSFHEDLKVICPLAALYVSIYTSGASADLATYRKSEKYANLPNSNTFQPIAFEKHCTQNASNIPIIH